MPSIRSYIVQLLMKLIRSVRKFGSWNTTLPVSRIRRLPNISPFFSYVSSLGNPPTPGMTWNAVSKRPVSVWPMVLVTLPSMATPKGTLLTTLTGAPPVLSTMPTVTLGTINTENTSSAVASHFQPCSFSGAKA